MKAVVLVFAVVFAVASLANRGSALSIVRDGVARAAIVMPPDAEAEEKAAAEDLRAYIERISGARLPEVADLQQGMHRIFIGRAASFSGLPASPPSMGPDEFIVQATDDALYLLGGDQRGTRYAVFDFLEQLGCRWYMPGEIGEVIPRLKTIEVKPMRRVEKPGFEFRQIWYAWGSSRPAGERLGQWLLRNKVGFIPIQHGHNLVNTVPPERHFKEHPEYYALVSGERKTTQLCTSNPDVVRLAIERVNRFFDDSPQTLAYSLCPDDNTDFCECANCRALDAGGTDPYTHKPLVTDRYVRFLNQVARGIQHQHPGKMVSTYAYVNYSIPPRREPIDPHVAVVFTTSVFCAAHGIGDAGCESRQKMKTLLKAWVTKGSRVYVYEYDPIPGNAELPCPLFGARAREMKVYGEMGVRGFSFESHKSWATMTPNYWFNARLMWNSNQSMNALLDDFCTNFFAESAAPMRRYYKALEAAFSKYPERVGWGTSDLPSIFGPATLRECREALSEADRSARQDLTRRRVAMAERAFEYLDNYLAARRVQAGRGTLASYRVAKQRCFDAVAWFNKENEDYMIGPATHPGLGPLVGELGSGQGDPDSLGLVTEWMVIGPFDNEGMKGHDTAYPPEREIALKARYHGKGKVVSWQPRGAVPWNGYMDLAAMLRPKDRTVAYALCWVTVPAETKCQMRVGSNDSVAVFIGGKKVHDNKVLRGAKVDEDIVPVVLPAGKTPILVKVGQTAGNWGFYFRLTDEQGNSLPGAKFTITP